MALDRRQLFSAVRITSAGDLLGTGSLLTVRSETFPQARYRYVVTAHHVIKNALEVAVEAPNPFGNGEMYPPVSVDTWWQPLPSVDLVVAPFQPQGMKSLLSNEIEAAFIPGPDFGSSELGATVFYVGIFQPLDRPMARSGTIGALDQDGIPHEGGYEYPAHLVDCRSYGGFSGSPCFELVTFTSLDETRMPQLSLGLPPDQRAQIPKRIGATLYFAMFCGMFTAHYSDLEWQDGVISRYGVGVMLRGAEIRRALMSEPMKEQRRRGDEAEAERRRREAEKGPKLRNVKAGNEEFERFEDLTRHLVQTPKPKRGDE